MTIEPSLEPIAQAVCEQRGLTFGGLVGAGTFKETFRASDATGDVAVKVYRRSGSPARATREINAMLACQHPNIAQLRAVDTISTRFGNHAYCLEEFFAGGTLADVPRGFWTEIAATRRIVRSLSDAIGHFAAKKLVHRDLKPENIMMRADGVSPVIVDFGIVRNLAAPSMTPTWAARGPCTPFFAPAEQLANDKWLIDWRSDQFSLGVTVAVLVIGSHPYAAAADEDHGAIIDRVARRPALSTAVAEKLAAAGLSPIVRMVASWPVHRYRTPEDLIAAWS